MENYRLQHEIIPYHVEIPGRGSLEVARLHHVYTGDNRPKHIDYFIDQPHDDGPLDPDHSKRFLKKFPEVAAIMGENGRYDEHFVMKTLGEFRRLEQDSGAQECTENLIKLIAQYYREIVYQNDIWQRQKDINNRINRELSIGCVESGKIGRCFVDRNRRQGFTSFEDFAPTLDHDHWSLRNSLPYDQVPHLWETCVEAYRIYVELQNQLLSQLSPQGALIMMHTMRNWTLPKTPLSPNIESILAFIEALNPFETDGVTEKRHALRREDVDFITTVPEDYPEFGYTAGYNPSDKKLVANLMQEYRTSGTTAIENGVYYLLPQGNCTQILSRFPGHGITLDYNIKSIAADDSYYTLNSRPKIDMEKVRIMMDPVAKHTVRRVLERLNSSL